MKTNLSLADSHAFTDGLFTKGTRAHTHRELIREWLWEPKGSSLESIQVLGGGSRRRDTMAFLRAGGQAHFLTRPSLNASRPFSATTLL